MSTKPGPPQKYTKQLRVQVTDKMYERLVKVTGNQNRSSFLRVAISRAILEEEKIRQSSPGSLLVEGISEEFE